MKKLFLLCISLALFTGKGIAQNVKTQSAEKKIRQEMALKAPQLYKQYKTGALMSGVGTGLTFGGVAAGITALLKMEYVTVKDGEKKSNYLPQSGKVFAYVGVACLLSGASLWIIGGTKKNKARNSYIRDFSYGNDVLDKPSPYLQLNTTSNGLGLAFVF